MNDKVYIKSGKVYVEFNGKNYHAGDKSGKIYPVYLGEESAEIETILSLGWEKKRETERNHSIEKANTLSMDIKGSRVESDTDSISVKIIRGEEEVVVYSDKFYGKGKLYDDILSLASEWGWI